MVTVKCKNVLINNVINVCSRDLVTFQNVYMLFLSESRDQGTRGREVRQFWCEVWKLLLHAGFLPVRTSWKKLFWWLEDLVSIYLEWFFHPLLLYACWVRLQGWCMDLIQLYFSCGICEIGQWLHSLLS